MKLKTLKELCFEFGVSNIRFDIEGKIYIRRPAVAGETSWDHLDPRLFCSSYSFTVDEFNSIPEWAVKKTP